MRYPKLPLALLALTAALAAPVGASAGSTFHVSGTYGVTDLGTTVCKPPIASAATFTCTTTGFLSLYSGGLAGTTVTTFTEQINCRTGRTHGSGDETFTGSIAGVGSGTLTWHDVFASDFDCLTFTVSNFHGIGIDLRGSGALAPLQGSFTFTDSTYDGTLH